MKSVSKANPKAIPVNNQKANLKNLKASVAPGHKVYDLDSTEHVRTQKAS